MTPYQMLDQENRFRVNALAKAVYQDQEINQSDICHSKEAFETLKVQKVILPSFDDRQICLNYPFAECIYTIICPKCITLHEPRYFSQVIRESETIPVLISSYASYPEKYIKEIVGIPHLNTYEFNFIRWMEIMQRSNGGGLCNHCAKERHDKIVKDVVERNVIPNGKILISHVFENLEPFVNPDTEVFKMLEKAAKASDAKALLALVGASEAISKLRTSEAFNARCTLPTRCISGLLEQANSIVPAPSITDIEYLSDAIEQAPHFEMPGNAKISKFFETARPHRAILAKTIDALVSNSSEAGELNVTKLCAQVQHLNSEVRRLSRSKRYLAYRTTLSFLKSNKTFVASALIAGVSGLAGSYLTCGISSVAGLVAKLFKGKLSKIKMPKDAEALGQEMAKSIRPPMYRLLSFYTGASLPAIQVQEISELMKQDEKTVA